MSFLTSGFSVQMHMQRLSCLQGKQGTLHDQIFYDFWPSFNTWASYDFQPNMITSLANGLMYCQPISPLNSTELCLTIFGGNCHNTGCKVNDQIMSRLWQKNSKDALTASINGQWQSSMAHSQSLHLHGHLESA